MGVLKVAMGDVPIFLAFPHINATRLGTNTGIPGATIGTPGFGGGGCRGDPAGDPKPPSLSPGVATTLTPLVVYGVVDLYGMAVKVTIVHTHNASDRLRRTNAILRALSPPCPPQQTPATNAGPPLTPPVPRLQFHPNCGQKAAVVNEGRTALRPQ